MKIWLHRPNWCEGFDPVSYEFNTKEEFLETDLAKAMLSDNGVICLSSPDLLMSVRPSDTSVDGCTWWVHSIMDDKTFKAMEDWFPTFDNVRTKFRLDKENGEKRDLIQFMDKCNHIIQFLEEYKNCVSGDKQIWIDDCIQWIERRRKTYLTSKPY